MAISVRLYPDDRPIDPWSHLRLWLLCGGGLLVLGGLGEDPAWVEAHFVDGFGGTASARLDWLTATLPLPLAEILAVALALVLLLTFLEALSDVFARRRRWWNALVGAALSLVSLGLLLGVFFQAAWGLSYQRVPAAERFALREVEQAASLDVAGLRALVGEASRKVNEAYVKLHGAKDTGTVTVPREGLDVDAALESAFVALAEREGLGPSFAARRGPTKEPYLSVVLSYLGVAGVYVPFTGEALVNAQPPAWSKVHTAAHEKAHQRLVAPEDEASFVGFLACVGSEEPLLRYAAWQFARSTLVSALRRVDPDAPAFLQDTLDPGPTHDLLAVMDHWARYAGPAEQAQEVVNDAYLRSQGVPDGVQSYQRASTLVAAWMRARRP